MLNRRFLRSARRGAGSSLPDRQGGVVLVVALIILVALMLGGIALVRSVGTTNIIAGNLAFQQAATQSGEAGTEAAIGRAFGAIRKNAPGKYPAGNRANPPRGKKPDTGDECSFT